MNESDFKYDEALIKELMGEDRLLIGMLQKMIARLQKENEDLKLKVSQLEAQIMDGKNG